MIVFTLWSWINCHRPLFYRSFRFSAHIKLNNRNNIWSGVRNRSISTFSICDDSEQERNWTTQGRDRTRNRMSNRGRQELTESTGSAAKKKRGKNKETDLWCVIWQREVLRTYENPPCRTTTSGSNKNVKRDMLAFGVFAAAAAYLSRVQTCNLTAPNKENDAK